MKSVTTLSWNVFLNWKIWGPIAGVLILIGLDTLLGIIQSIKAKTFSWDKVGDCVKKIGIQFSGIVVLGLVGIFNDAFLAAFLAAIAVYSVSLIASITSKIASFIPTSVPATQATEAASAATVNETTSTP